MRYGSTSTAPGRKRTANGAVTPRALQALAPAYRKGQLLDDMTKWAPRWNGDTSSPQFAAMVEMTWLGARTWEEILLMPGKPWSAHITAEQRRGLKRVVDAGHAHAGR